MNTGLILGRLYVKGAFVGFRRSHRHQVESQALINIQGVNDKQSSKYYNGKRVAYIYKAQTLKQNTKYRAVWGKVMGSHGSNGLVRVHFKKNLPPKAMGALVRVMLYPNRA